MDALSDDEKTREQLIAELAAVRRELAELTAESSDKGRSQAKTMWEANQRLLDAIVEDAPT